MNCINCGNELHKRKQRSNKKYCSSKCKQEYERKEKIEKWLKGELTGVRGSSATSKWVKWYLIKTRGEKCERCGWNEVNPYTGNIPIELEHIDGDFTNNHLDNLILLCPNHHSLTPTYKGVNKGNGKRNNKAKKRM